MGHAFLSPFSHYFVALLTRRCGRYPQRTTSRDQSASAKVSFEGVSDFCAAPTCFSSVFRVFVFFSCFVFVSVFLIARYFLFICQKNKKNLEHQTKQQKTQNLFLFGNLENLVARAFLRPRRAGHRSGRNGGPRDPRNSYGRRPASGPLWGVGPPQANFPDSKMTSKNTQKGPKNEQKKRHKMTPKTIRKSQKIAKKHQKTPNKCGPKRRQNQQKIAKKRAKNTRKKELNFSKT